MGRGGRAPAIRSRVRRTLDHGAQINHHVKYNQRVFHERFHMISVTGALGDALTSQVTVIYPWMCVCVVLNVAV